MNRELFKVETAVTNIVNPHHSEEAIEKAMTFTLWSWYDVMTAFREVGYDPTEEEEQRIKRALFTKKLKHILKERY
ncbi:hypothetical protein DRO03_10295 [Methanosarcinales archaeon]|nr:MAG: hypothetical protein DRO03_10295 [Methanosarcinales archaeon]